MTVNIQGITVNRDSLHGIHIHQVFHFFFGKVFTSFSSMATCLHRMLLLLDLIGILLTLVTDVQAAQYATMEIL